MYTKFLFIAILYVSIAIETLESKYVQDIISRIYTLMLYGTFIYINKFYKKKLNIKGFLC